MSGFSDYLEAALVNATLRGGTYTGGPVFAAVFTADPTDAALATELTDTGYVRQRLHDTVVSDGLTAPVNGVVTNTHNLVYPAIAGLTFRVTHWGLFDALAGGNLLYHAPMANPKTLDQFDVLSFPPGALSVALR